MEHGGRVGGGWGERELREFAFIVVVIFLSNFQLLLQCESIPLE